MRFEFALFLGRLHTEDNELFVVGQPIPDLVYWLCEMELNIGTKEMPVLREYLIT